jgi:hypothetical protein
VLLSYLGPQPWTADALRGTRSEALLRLVSARLPLFVDRHSVAAHEVQRWLGPGVVQAAGPEALVGSGGAEPEPQSSGELEGEASAPEAVPPEVEAPEPPAEPPGTQPRVR